MKAALYTRVSTEEQVETGFSLDAQKRRLIEYCTANNIEIYNLYSDEGISGHSITKRKALQELLLDAKQKKFDILLVYKTDRLSRNLLDLLTIKKELDSYGVELVLSDEAIDTKDDTGMTMFSIMGAFAELERKKITQRMIQGKREKMRTTKNKPNQAHIPYGYIYDNITKNYLVDESQRENIKNIFNLFESGVGIVGICKYLLENKIDFGKNKTSWYTSDVARILKNPIYKGFAAMSYCNTYNGKKCQNEKILVKANNIEAIVTEDQWDRVNMIYETKSKYWSRKYSNDMFLFYGLLYCSECGYKLTTRQTTLRTSSKTGVKKRYYYYQCNAKFKVFDSALNCDGFHLKIEVMHQMFIDFIKDLNIKSQIKMHSTSTPDFQKEKTNLENSIRTKTRQKEMLLDKLLNETISDEDFKTMSNKLTSQIDGLKIDLISLDERISKINDKNAFDANLIEKIKSLKQLIKVWNKLDDIDIQYILNSCISRIYINKNSITKIEFK